MFLRSVSDVAQLKFGHLHRLPWVVFRSLCRVRLDALRQILRKLEVFAAETKSATSLIAIMSTGLKHLLLFFELSLHLQNVGVADAGEHNVTEFLLRQALTWMIGTGVD